MKKTPWQRIRDVPIPPGHDKPMIFASFPKGCYGIACSLETLDKKNFTTPDGRYYAPTHWKLKQPSQKEISAKQEDYNIDFSVKFERYAFDKKIRVYISSEHYTKVLPGCYLNKAVALREALDYIGALEWAYRDFANLFPKLEEGE